MPPSKREVERELENLKAVKVKKSIFNTEIITEGKRKRATPIYAVDRSLDEEEDEEDQAVPELQRWPQCDTLSTEDGSDSDNNTDQPGLSLDEQEVMQNKMINEEYKIWKKNSVFLYDIMYR